MTDQMKTLLNFLCDYIAEHDSVSPSYEEIANYMGLASKSNVYRIVRELEDRGLVTRLFGQARSLRPVEGPIRSQLECWSDAVVLRVALDLREIIRDRGLGRRVAA